MPRTAIVAAVCGRHARWCRATLLAVLALAAVATSTAAFAVEPVAGEASLTKPGDYARLVIMLQSEVDAQVGLAGSILIIRFKQPVDVPVEKLSAALPDYVGAARVDPDGMAIRLALNRKVKPNMMTAGERLFVDLLPETWTGAPPGLPAEVVKELADRARAAEQLLRQQKLAAAPPKRPPVRVKASRQPTFVRYVFDLSSGANVSSMLSAGKLVLSFTPALTFDLADAEVIAAANIVSISQKAAADSATVTFDLVGDVDVHSFREEKTYIVDIGFEPETRPNALLNAPAEAGDAAGPEEKPSAERPAPMPSEQPAEKPPTSAAAEPNVTLREKNAPAAGSNMEMPRAVSPDPKPEIAVRPAPAEPAATVPKPSAAGGAEKTSREASSITIQAKRSGALMRLFVPLAPTRTGAVFSRDDALWLVFDENKSFLLDQVVKEGAGLVSEATTVPLAGGRAIRLRLSRPQLFSVLQEGSSWIIELADAAQAAPLALSTVRNIAEAGRGTISVPVTGAGELLKVTDPAAGDTLLVVTAALPAKGFVRRQNFVDFSLLESVHGIVLQPNSDDLRVDVAADKVTVSRPDGLILSATGGQTERQAGPPPAVFDLAQWKADREAVFGPRRDALMTTAAMASGEQRNAAHLELARFYIANGLYPEAKGALDVLFKETKGDPVDAGALTLHAVANILRGDPENGLAELRNTAIESGTDIQLWKAVAYARLGRWAEAREKFKGIEFAIGSLPVDLQRLVITDELRAALEVRDYAGVSTHLNELNVIGVPPRLQPQLALMRARMDEALGRDIDALGEYAMAAASDDRGSAAAARVNEIALKQKRGEISRDDALAALETLAFTWRGDAVEVRTQQVLAHLYADLGRYRDALVAARSATKIQANSEASRQLQDEAAALFSDIFLGQKGDDLQPVQALALFYEFSALTPIGRRGDELIRRLAERLVAIDLLDQASELLQYQIDQRLEGAARAQVAARLAMIYLMNRKPDRAIAVLRSSRISDLAGELRTQRLLIEARAHSDIGRPELALDIITNVAGREAIRLRSDIYWAARRWRESAEQIELMYGDRWRDFQPLTTEEKSDIVRAAIGYSLAEDQLGTARLREKYAAKMDSGADKAAFDRATQAAAASSADFPAIAKMAAAVDTLSGFLRDMKSRFPEIATKAALPDERSQADPLATGSLPKIEGLRPARGSRL